MSLSKSSQHSTSNLLKKAQQRRIDFSITRISSENLLELLNAHADAIGVPIEFILWPLLTVAASFMGINAHIQVNHSGMSQQIFGWLLPPKKGEKRLLPSDE